jgi:DNA-binding NtrC family response regulator
VAGLGATFTIFLPEVTGMSDSEPESAPSGDLRGEGTVLLVEDQDQVRKITARVLAEAGYEVLECATPDEALGFAEACPDEIRLMLSDIVMPGMNGLELANRVKPLRPEMKVILMSGYTDHASVDTDSIEKAGEFLAKPFTPDALKAKVLKALAARGSKQTILVVDDEPPVRRLICEILTAAGYSALEAANGLEAVRLIHASPIDLMITDLSMPEQEGLETIRMLHREHSKLKMIAISGRFPPPMLRAAEMFGAHASLAKPIDRDELLETVARVIQGGNL